MAEELEKLINGEREGNEIKLHGTIRLHLKKGGSFTVGAVCVKGAIRITRPNTVIDGSDAELIVEVEDCTTSDWALFLIQPSARNVRFQNLRLRVHIQNQVATTRRFSLFYNTAYGVQFEHCSMEVCSERQLNLAGIYNNGNLDTHMETRADNLVVSNCFIKAECLAEQFPKECRVYGLYNYLANSISVQNTYIYATNRGEGERQQAIGVYTNGRFGRFVGNNIKANGTHNIGLEKEQAYTYGFINEGLYTIITSNNIIGEWAGKCVGLQTDGEYAIISSNKVLATHTICGRSIVSQGNYSKIEGNILTSTSRNARLLEHDAANCVITNNIMEILMGQEECGSGCAIYAAGDNCYGNIISENMIRNVKDAGLFLNHEAGTVLNNMVVSYRGTVERAWRDDAAMLMKLDERRIRSIIK